MITRLLIENFKSIGSPGVNLDLKPLTILVGPNGSGKSSILQALTLLSQKIGRTFEEWEDIERKTTKASQVADIVYKRGPGKWLTFQFDLRVNEYKARRWAEMRSVIDEKRLGIKIEPSDVVGYKYSCRPESSEARQSVMIGGQEIVTVASIYKVEEKALKSVFEYPSILVESSPGPDPRYILRPEVFGQSTKIPSEAKPLTDLSSEIIETMAAKLGGKVFLLSALRGDIPYSAETGPPPTWIGMKGEHLLPILTLADRREHKERREKIAEWAREFGLVDVGAAWAGHNLLDSDYADPDLGVILNSALAGHGSRQVLCIITQLFWSEPDNIVTIEEPEISLHPNSQAKLPELFAEAVHDGKQVIVTTHSEFLLLALSRPIRRGLIKPSDIAIYHIDKGPDGTTAKPLEVTDSGYVKGWVHSFAEIERKLLKEWIETVPEEE